VGSRTSRPARREGRRAQERALELESGIAEIIHLCMRSTIHIIRYETWLGDGAAPLPPEGKVRRLLADEREIVARALELVARAPRLGYHSAAHTHLYTPRDLQRKLRSLDRLLGRGVRTRTGSGRR
jgi:hypothetical protein